MTDEQNENTAVPRARAADVATIMSAIFGLAGVSLSPENAQIIGSGLFFFMGIIPIIERKIRKK
jgi:hypothetical protein